MKTTFRFFKSMLIASSIVIVSVIAFSSCKKDDNNNNNNSMYTISGDASGSQMAPVVTGTGSGSISGTYNANNKMLIYTSTWTNLTSAPLSAAFYNGATGVAGTAVGGEWSLGTGLAASGTFTDTLTLTTDQETQLTTGNWYYSYLTAANPTGEIRGQITATKQ